MWSPPSPLATVEPATPGPHRPGTALNLSRAGHLQPAPNLNEVVMNHIRRVCRSLSGLPRRAGRLVASAAPAMLWADPPLPPGWNKYLHLPAVRFPPAWTRQPRAAPLAP